MITNCLSSNSCCDQQPLSKPILACQITALALGIILASAGLVAYLATTGTLPASLAFVGSEAAITLMVCGSFATLVALFLPIPKDEIQEAAMAEEIEEKSEAPPKSLASPKTPKKTPPSEKEIRTREALKSAILKRCASSEETLPPEIYSIYVDDFSEKSQKALDICQEENLYLLYKSPNTQTPKRALPPEAAQRPLQWIAQNPELKKYTETLLQQLAIFACRFYSYEEVEATKESPLECNDIQLSEDGYLESLDIDILSLFGLLDTFTPTWFAKYRETVNNSGQYIPQARTPQRLELIVQDLDQRRKAVAFHQQNNITSVTQLLVYDKRKFSAETTAVQGVIKSLIKLINKQLQDTPDLVSGRRISYHLKGMFSDPLYKANETSFSSSYNKFKMQGIDPALKALQEKGYCYHTLRKYGRDDSTLLLYC